ncbi:TetR/AcrR family transcriptional regulator [Rhodococcus fascians]|uniref:TetR/AcrR family transcriptional regulator n=1 Tax=Rhodococcoides fascians TaxID=1828 RepID=UPI001C5DA957|nr:TetR/AcrR family transcriptional regulator [Rhodococcus fascians]MBW4781922.1 TetR/AcrR family transcriptional regulator [Rhodococcus fascians]
MTQQRAIKTRAAVLDGAGTEFAQHGYVGASVNRIIESTTVTKGAMYFHFQSKEAMAEAILDNAAAVYTAIANRWTAIDGVHPFDAIAGMVDDAAQAFSENIALRAEARLTVETEFFRHRPLSAWDAAVLDLAGKAGESGCLRQDFTATKFMGVLSASLAGHRLLAHTAPTGTAASLEAGYREAVDTVLAASRTVTCIESHGSDRTRASA